MGLFSRKIDVEALKGKRDFLGLAKALNSDAREEAAAAIAELDDAAAVEPLMRIYQRVRSTDDGRVVEDAVVSLGEKAVPPLVAALAEEPRHATETALVLARFGEPAALEPLVALTGEEATAKAAGDAGLVRRGAYAGLVRLGTPTALAAVVRGLEDGPDFAAPAEAIRSQWTGDEANVAKALFARARLVYELEAAVDQAAASRTQPPEDETRRLDERAVAATVDALLALAVRVREGSVPGTDIIAICIEARRDPNPKVRGMSASLLGEMFTADSPPRPEIGDALAALLGDESEWARGMAAGALAGFGDPRARDPLVALLDAKDERVTVNAAEALVRLADKSVIPELGKRIKVSTSDRSTAIAKASRELSSLPD